jgi:hypothetical protein
MRKQVGLAVSVGLLAFCSYAQNPPFIPGSAESVGLTRIVPDTLVWFNTVTMKPQINGFVPNTDASIGGSIDPAARLLGDSTFLLAAGLKATNDVSLMCRNMVLIPTAGGPPKLDSAFYDDAGQIYLRDSNDQRQDGNPGRVGGDMRYGAVNYMTAAEATLYEFPDYFGSDSRWSNTFFDTMKGTCRDYEAQNFRLDPLTLAVTSLHKACSPMFWPTHTNDTPAIGQPGRTGSSPIGLANGNFVTVGQDQSATTQPGTAAIATIFKPDGTIVKNAWMVNFPDLPGGSDMWDSVGAWRGGFFAKPANGITYLFDNDGNALGTITNNDSAGVNFDTGRSDGTRYCSDIRSHYIFGAGKSPEANPGFTNMMLCAWDANTRLWITNTIVSEGNQDPTDLGGTRFMDRANVACDAYDRVTVAYRLKPDNVTWPNDQIVARVFQFTGTNFIPLTPSFFAFIQHDGSNVLTSGAVGFLGMEPSVAMTPRQILIYAKGLWNGIPNATTAPTTLGNSHCYTILSHPAPIAAPRPNMTITPGSPNSTISWQADAGLFVLQATATANVPASWADVSPQPAITRTAYVNPTDKYQMSVPTPTSPKYFRLVRHW